MNGFRSRQRMQLYTNPTFVPPVVKMSYDS